MFTEIFNYIVKNLKLLSNNDPYVIFTLLYLYLMSYYIINIIGKIILLHYERKLRNKSDNFSFKSMFLGLILIGFIILIGYFQNL